MGKAQLEDITSTADEPHRTIALSFVDFQLWETAPSHFGC